jgi:hypothetical protein
MVQDQVKDSVVDSVMVLAKFTATGMVQVMAMDTVIVRVTV